MKHAVSLSRPGKIIRWECSCGCAGGYRPRPGAAIEAAIAVAEARAVLHFTPDRRPTRPEKGHQGSRVNYLRHIETRDKPCVYCVVAYFGTIPQDPPPPQPMRLLDPPRRRRYCGTLRGYRSHRRHSESACDRCREARLEYVKLTLGKRSARYAKKRGAFDAVEV